MTTGMHTTQQRQRTDQSRAHPQVHDDGPDIAAVAETDVAASATAQSKAESNPPSPPAHLPAMASDSETEGGRNRE